MSTSWTTVPLFARRKVRCLFAHVHKEKITLRSCRGTRGYWMLPRIIHRRRWRHLTEKEKNSDAVENHFVDFFSIYCSVLVLKLNRVTKNIFFFFPFNLIQFIFWCESFFWTLITKVYLTFFFIFLVKGKTLGFLLQFFLILLLHNKEKKYPPNNSTVYTPPVHLDWCVITWTPPRPNAIAPIAFQIIIYCHLFSPLSLPLVCWIHWAASSRL